MRKIIMALSLMMAMLISAAALAITPVQNLFQLSHPKVNTVTCPQTSVVPGYPDFCSAFENIAVSNCKKTGLPPPGGACTFPNIYQAEQSDGIPFICETGCLALHCAGAQYTSCNKDCNDDWNCYVNGTGANCAGTCTPPTA